MIRNFYAAIWAAYAGSSAVASAHAYQHHFLASYLLAGWASLCAVVSVCYLRRGTHV